MSNIKARETQKETEIKELSKDMDNYVAMSNKMVLGKSKLTLNEHKLMRLLIMQLRPQDDGLFIVRVGAMDIAELFGIPKSDVYRDLNNITTHIMREVIEIADGEKKYKKFHWIDTAEYDNGVAIFKLSEELRPYILGLKDFYTQYRLGEIASFRSTYAIRIFEVIMEALNGLKPHADKIGSVYIDIETIKRVTDTEDKYKNITLFQHKVIDMAVRNMNDYSPYHVSAEPKKESRKIVGFYFIVESKAGYAYRMNSKKKKRNEIKSWAEQH